MLPIYSRHRVDILCYFHIVLSTPFTEQCSAASKLKRDVGDVSLGRRQPHTDDGARRGGRCGRHRGQLQVMLQAFGGRRSTASDRRGRQRRGWLRRDTPRRRLARHHCQAPADTGERPHVYTTQWHRIVMHIIITIIINIARRHYSPPVLPPEFSIRTLVLVYIFPSFHCSNEGTLSLCRYQTNACA